MAEAVCALDITGKVTFKYSGHSDFIRNGQNRL